MAVYPPLFYFLLALVTPLVFTRYPRVYRVVSCLVPVLASPLIFYLFDRPPFNNLACDMSIFGVSLHLLDISPIGLLFAWAFSIAALCIAIYSWHQKRLLDATLTPLYAGAALAGVLTGDLLSFFVALEIMTIVAAGLIFAQKTTTSFANGIYYLMFHLFSGMCVLVGIILCQIEGNTSLLFLPLAHGTLSWLFISIGLGVKVALIPFQTWLVASYDESDDISLLSLSLFTTKVALYGIIVLLPGSSVLVEIGLATFLYQGVRSLFSVTLKRGALRFLGAQLGLMTLAANLVPSSIVGVYAFNHILYDTLLFIALGSIVYYKATTRLAWAALGVAFLSMLGMPPTVGFLAKAHVEHALHVLPWLDNITTILSGVLIVSSLLFMRRLPSVIHSVCLPIHIRIALWGGMLICVGPFFVPAFWLPYEIMLSFTLHQGLLAGVGILLFCGLIWFKKDKDMAVFSPSLLSPAWTLYTLYKAISQQVLFELLALITFLRIGLQTANSFFNRLIANFFSLPEVRFNILEWRGMHVFIRDIILLLCAGLFFCVLF